MRVVIEEPCQHGRVGYHTWIAPKAEADPDCLYCDGTGTWGGISGSDAYFEHCQCRRRSCAESSRREATIIQPVTYCAASNHAGGTMTTAPNQCDYARWKGYAIDDKDNACEPAAALLIRVED